MRHTRLLHQPSRQRYGLRRDHSRRFARYLGRSLTRRERDIVTALELGRNRAWRPTRLLIVDTPDYDSRPLLVRYAEYLRPLPGRIVIFDRTRPEARSHSRLARGFSLRRPDSCRGMTFTHALLFNVKPRHLTRLIMSVAPTLPVGYPNMMVIHTTGRVRPPAAFIAPGMTPTPGVYPLDPDKIYRLVLLPATDSDTVASATPPDIGRQAGDRADPPPRRLTRTPSPHPRTISPTP